MSVVFIQSELPQEKGEGGEGGMDRQEDGVSAISL